MDLREARIVPERKPPKPTPEERLERMKQSFDADFSMLAEDYEFFTTGASTPPSKAGRTSAAPRAKRSPKRS
jgi:hypothetical protein